MTITVEHACEMAYDYYEDFYEEPRSIHYMELSQQLGSQSLPLLDFVAAALDVGCRDAENGVEKRDKEEVIEMIGGRERIAETT